MFLFMSLKLQRFRVFQMSQDYCSVRVLSVGTATGNSVLIIQPAQTKNVLKVSSQFPSMNLNYCCI